MCDRLYTPGAPIRALLIRAAELDVQRYFRPPGEHVYNGSEVHVSELDWLLRFGKCKISPDMVRDFVRVYRLYRCVSWECNTLSDVVGSWPARSSGFHFGVLQSRIDELVDCHAQRKFLRSAASKLSFFTNPFSHVFIWDSNARRAIDHRYPLRAHPRQNGYTDRELQRFWENAPSCLSDELGRGDFRRSLNSVVPLLDPVRGSVFSSNEQLIRDFAARRLLDKLMYYEGRLLKEHFDGPCGPKAQDTVREWIKELENDIAAANEANQPPEAAD